MPREGKTAITVDKETYDSLRDRKPDGVTWDRFLKNAVRTWDGMGDR